MIKYNILKYKLEIKELKSNRRKRNKINKEEYREMIKR